jgi:hypothetical protein
MAPCSSGAPLARRVDSAASDVHINIYAAMRTCPVRRLALDALGDGRGSRHDMRRVSGGCDRTT